MQHFHCSTQFDSVCDCVRRTRGSVRVGSGRVSVVGDCQPAVEIVMHSIAPPMWWPANRKPTEKTFAMQFSIRYTRSFSTCDGSARRRSMLHGTECVPNGLAVKFAFYRWSRKRKMHDPSGNVSAASREVRSMRPKAISHFPTFEFATALDHKIHRNQLKIQLLLPSTHFNWIRMVLSLAEMLSPLCAIVPVSDSGF